MVQKPLSEVADVVRGIAFPKEDKSYVQRPGDVACLRTTNVQKQVEWHDLWFVPAKYVKRDDQNVRTGDILISTANSYELVGKVAQVAGLPTPATLGAFISLIRPKDGVHPKFLYHQLAWGKTQTRIREMSSNTTNISNVSTKKLATLELLVPNFDEQTLIVDELEKQFSRLDEAVANLQRVKANLKRYKAAVLKAAVEGRLVETEASLAHREGRSYETGEQLLQRILEERRCKWLGKGKYKEPLPVATDELPPLVDGWVYANGGQLFRWSSGVNLPVKNLTGGDTPVYGGNGINGWHSDSNVSHATLVIGRVGAGCGNVNLVERTAWVTDNAIYATEVPVDCSLAYLEIVYTTANLNSVAAGSGQPFLNQTILNESLVALPSRTEQIRIVAEVDRHLSIVREVEAEVDTNLKRAQALRQATLTTAFSATT